MATNDNGNVKYDSGFNTAVRENTNNSLIIIDNDSNNLSPERSKTQQNFGFDLNYAQEASLPMIYFFGAVLVDTRIFVDFESFKFKVY